VNTVPPGPPGPGHESDPAGIGPPTPYSAYPPAVATPDERNWAMMAHLLSFVAVWFAFGFVAPLVVMLTKGKESAFVRHHAVESLNFQLTALIAGLISAVLVIVLVGLLFLLVVGVMYVIFVILASVAANRGDWYRYPLTIRFVS